MTAVLALPGVLLVALCAAYAAIGHWLDRYQERAEIEYWRKVRGR